MSNRTGIQFAGMLTARIAANALQAVNVIILARAVKPDVVGIASAVISLSMVLFTLTDMGVSTYVMKAYAVGDLLATRAGLRLIRIITWSAAITASVIGVAVSGPLGVPLAAIPLLASVAIDRGVEFRLGVPIAAASISIPAVSILLRRGVQIAGFLLMWELGSSALFAYSAAQLIGALAGYVHSIFFLRTYLEHPTRLPRPLDREPAAPGSAGDRQATSVRGVLHDSFPYLVHNVSLHIQLLDTFLVTTVAGAFRGGLYSAATRITSPLVLIPGTLAAAILPAAAQTTTGAARSIALKLSAATPVLVAVFAIGGVLAAEPVCTIVFGDAYRDAATPLTLLLTGIPFAILGAALSALLQARNQAGRVAKIGLAGAIVFVAAVAIGAQFGGATGAALGGLIALASKCIPLIIWSAQLNDESSPATTSTEAGAHHP